MIMEIVIDRAFLNEYYSNSHTPEDKNKYKKFINFIKELKRGEFKLICDFDGIEEIDFYIMNNALLSEIDEKEPEYVLCPDLYKKIKEVTFYEKNGGLKLFFLNNSGVNNDDLENQFGYKFFSEIDITNRWNLFLTDKEIKRYFVTNNPGISNEDKFDSWSKLMDFKHPVNSIVVADKYILCDGSLQPLEHNLKPLLCQLIPNNKNLIPVDITIIAKQDVSKKPFEALKTDLEKYIKGVVPKAKINLTLIDLDNELEQALKNKYKSDFHDRRIVTTYYWYEVGKGFNLFRHHNKLNPSNSKLYIGFNLFASNQDDVRLLLEEYAACASLAKKEQYYGTNKNRLLLPYQN
jgi:hypothetical protein